MKTCVNCKFITSVQNDPKVGYCDTEQSVISINVVTGRSLISTCESMRSDDEKCGIDGTLFVQRTSADNKITIGGFKNWFLA